MRSEDMSVEASTKGDVAPADLDKALDKVGAVAERCGAPVLAAQVRLVSEPSPSVERPARAEATLHVNGEPVRAQVAAGTMGEAVDLLVDRLTHRLERHEDRRRRLDSRHWTAIPPEGGWRHGDLPNDRPPYFEREVDDREVVRRKAYDVGGTTLDEAAFDLDQLGHDFHLFRMAETGRDAVIAYGEDGLELACVGAPPVPSESAVPLAAISGHAPTLTEAEACERLDVGVERFVLFVNPSTGRGNVLYRRYDGHYGLIEPL
jgi:ribosome-associated translation inhibitor RaiA